MTDKMWNAETGEEIKVTPKALHDSAMKMLEEFLLKYSRYIPDELNKQFGYDLGMLAKQAKHLRWD